MSPAIIDQLATSLGQRDEKPNIDLAIRIVKSNKPAQVAELMSLLQHKKSDIRNDAIKVAYEIGERKPELITDYLDQFLQLLNHKENRMQWGAMSAISAISQSRPEWIARHLVKIISAMENGTVITRDHGIYILTYVAKLKKYHTDAMELLLEQLEQAPVNQLPMYAEKTAEVISKPFIPRFRIVLTKRKDVWEIPSKAKRIEKVIKALETLA